jgi:hypothetical protein
LKNEALDNLINDWLFDRQEPRAYCSSEAASRFLLRFLKSDGANVQVSENAGYFFCTIAKGDEEVCADSRANLRPRTIKEAICVAALKIYLPESDKRSWNKVYKALELKL